MRPRSHFWRIAAVIAVAATVLAMLWLPAAARAQSSDSLSASPTSGPPGTIVTLKGAGFTAYPGDPVEIDISIDHGNGNWDLLVSGAANPVPDANGNFTTNVTIPANAPSGDLLAISTISEPEADAFFTVTGPSSTGTSVPAAPSNLTVKAVDQHDITLNWQDNSGNETGFQINNGVISRDVGASSTTYTWGGLAPGTYMCFHVRAYNNAGYSAWDPNVSPWYVCTTTPKPKPQPEPAPAPTIYWSQISGRPGTLVTLTGNGWAPGGTVVVHLPSNGFFIGNSSWRISSTGSWKQSFTVADTTPGAYTVSFTETTGHLNGTGSFRVLAAPNAGQDWSRCQKGSCTIALDHERTQVLVDTLNATPKPQLLTSEFALCNAYTVGLIRVACSVFATGIVVDASLLARQLSDSDLGRGVYITFLTIHFTKLGITPQK